MGDSLAPKPATGKGSLTQDVKGGHQGDIHPVLKVFGHQSELQDPG